MGLLSLLNSKLQWLILQGLCRATPDEIALLESVV